MFSASLAACLCPWLVAEVQFEQQRQPRPLPAPFHKNAVNPAAAGKKKIPHGNSAQTQTRSLHMQLHSWFGSL